MKLKKILSAIVAGTMALSLANFNVMAAETLPAADSDGVITLTDDVTLNEVWNFNANGEDVVIDLNNNTLKLTKTENQLSNGNITIKNGKLDLSELKATSEGILRYGGYSDGEGTLTLNAVTVDATNATAICAVIMLNGGKESAYNLVLDDTDIIANHDNYDDAKQARIIYANNGKSNVTMTNGSTITSNQLKRVILGGNLTMEKESSMTLGTVTDEVFSNVSGKITDSTITVTNAETNVITYENAVGSLSIVNSTVTAETVGNEFVAFVDDKDDDVTVTDAKVYVDDNSTVNEDATGISTYVATVDTQGYYNLQDAVNAAAEGDTITVIADISDVAVKVDKSVTITGDATLNNVSITANDTDVALTVSNLNFKGNSWINSNNAKELTVSGVTADVAPVNGTAINSRSAFIALGSSEHNKLKLTVENSSFIVPKGVSGVLGWAQITEATIKDNNFGDEDHVIGRSETGIADAAKFMSIADGAEFNITGNTAYTTSNGFVFGQNTTRDNAYTVNVDGNTFNGSGDHIWVEVSGATTTHATVKATSNNTVNGETFTVDDIKYTSRIKTWTSYAGVDVVTNSEGKVIGGTLKTGAFSEDALAEGYTTDDSGNVIIDDVKTVIEGAEDGNTITLLKDFEVSETITITEDITLDLNGKTITSTVDYIPMIKNNGTLTIEDSVGGGKIESVNGDWSAVLENNVGGTVIMNGGSLVGTRDNASHYVVVNHGDMTINGGSVTTNGTGSALIENGWQNSSENTTKTPSNMTINGGYFSGGNYNVKNDSWGFLTINGGTFENDGSVNIMNWNELSITDGSFKNTRYSIWVAARNGDEGGKGTIDITGGDFEAAMGIFTTYANGTSDNVNISGGTFKSDNPLTIEWFAEDYAPSYDEINEKWVVVNKTAAEDPKNALEVEFVETDNTNVYDIVISSDVAINKFTSAQLAFSNVLESGEASKVGYEISTNVEGMNLSSKDVVGADGVTRTSWLFNASNRNGFDGTDIVIGQVTFDGYGEVNFKVDTAVDNDDDEANNNLANTTTSINNKTVTYKIGGGEGFGTLVVNDAEVTDKNDDGKDESGVIDTTFEKTQYTLTVNVIYPNKITDQAAAYQDMTVTISGGDLAVPIVKNLGSDDEALTDDGLAVKYVVTEKLTEKTAYTVTVKGAGYRTARYTVNMQETDKTLKFWNNLMTNAESIEAGTSAPVKTNFLAGDIVKDNIINIYDLSAVVSYFGTTNDTTGNDEASNKMAKYDLNRDGVIDSRDVAYVLNGWNN